MSHPRRGIPIDTVPPSPELCAIVALPEEAQAILEERAFAWKRINDRVWDSEAFDLRLALSGIGKVLASWCFARYAADAGRVLSIGTSGGLGGEEVGSLWIVDEFVEHDLDLSGLGFESGITPWESMEGPVIHGASREFVEVARRACAAARIEADTCRSASGDSFIADSRAARALAARTGARLVDMESAAIAKLAHLRACIPIGREQKSCPEFLGFRYVSDNADHAAEDSWKEEIRKASVDFADFLLEMAKAEALPT
ncbi:MAG TPA: hypothetical protein VMV44_15320 [Rectinemataceae bacterium]|nr:hypothetical protein [Rectinemataceae bacterium]